MVFGFEGVQLFQRAAFLGEDLGGAHDPLMGLGREPLRTSNARKVEQFCELRGSLRAFPSSTPRVHLRGVVAIHSVERVGRRRRVSLESQKELPGYDRVDPVGLVESPRLPAGERLRLYEARGLRHARFSRRHVFANLLGSQ